MGVSRAHAIRSCVKTPLTLLTNFFPLRTAKIMVIWCQPYQQWLKIPQKLREIIFFADVNSNGNRADGGCEKAKT